MRMSYYRHPWHHHLATILIIAAVLAVPVGLGLAVRELARSRDQVAALEQQLAAHTERLEGLAQVTRDAQKEAIAAREAADHARSAADRARASHQARRDSVVITAPDSATVAGVAMALPPLVVRVIQEADRTIASQAAALEAAHLALEKEQGVSAAALLERDEARRALATSEQLRTQERQRRRWQRVQDVAGGAIVGGILGALTVIF